ncbi:uncharacterized protein LOC143025505 isoform X2 [Oratosquilla oratoria]|uniref:uncharacterized protein LOC143025505 isoform X2 n=1 Tax=Oratosquilla oratoria TaxID=337810 RepID=UPI003F7649F8
MLLSRERGDPRRPACRFQTQGTLQLPDVITSNTPPASPLHRTPSPYYVFPDKYHSHPSEVQSDHVPVEEMGSHEPVSPSEFVATTENEGEDGQDVHRGVERIQDIRRILTTPGEMVDRSRHQLCWQVPQPKKSKGSTRTSTAPLCQACSPQSEEAGTWKLIGSDLRMIADQFQMTHARGRAKWDGLPFSLAVPLVLSRCVSASLMFLLWWRLYNRFR